MPEKNTVQVDFEPIGKRVTIEFRPNPFGSRTKRRHCPSISVWRQRIVPGLQGKSDPGESLPNYPG